MEYCVNSLCVEIPVIKKMKLLPQFQFFRKDPSIWRTQASDNRNCCENPPQNHKKNKQKEYQEKSPS